MISREEKNKKYIEEIQREKTISISKKVFKVLGIFIIIFITLFLYIYFYGIKGLTTKEYVIRDSTIPDSFSGTKILHFSDLLYGSTINKTEILNIKKEIELINPDIVFFTGNLVFNNYDIDENEIKQLNEFLKNIPYTIGKYAVMGDMDNTTFNLIMEDTNFTILDNEQVDIYINKERINLIGINDQDIKEISTKDGYTITLINNYDNYAKYHLTSNIVLSGHNLGGEIRLFNLPLLGTDKYLNNYYEENNSKVYISSGLGSISHMRFMNKPSMNVYRLYNN